MLKEDNYTNKGSRWSLERYKQNYKGEDKGSCYDNPEFIRHPYPPKPILHIISFISSPRKKVKTNFKKYV